MGPDGPNSTENNSDRHDTDVVHEYLLAPCHHSFFTSRDALEGGGGTPSAQLRLSDGKRRLHWHF